MSVVAVVSLFVHKYEIAPVPPVAEMVISPSQSPLQVGCFNVTNEMVGPPIFPTFAVVFCSQPTLSVTVTP